MVVVALEPAAKLDGDGGQADDGGAAGDDGVELVTEPVLLVCDLDGTLLGDEAALAEFCRLWKMRLDGERRSRRRSARSMLAFATGRSYDDYVGLVESGVLPEPDVSITSTGAEIRCPSNSVLEDEWAWHVASVWDPQAVEAALQPFDLKLLSSNNKRIVYGPQDGGTEVDVAGQLDGMAAALREAQVKVELILSTHHDGTFLDVMPEGVDKGSAVTFVRDHLKIPYERTVVAGDSGNDWAMMDRGGLCRVLVGNATPDLIQRCQGLGDGTVYQAKGCNASGVIEGCRRFGVFPSL